MSSIDYEDYGEYCCCGASKYEISSDARYVLGKYEDFFEKVESSEGCNVPVYVEKGYDYQKTAQRIFTVGGLVVRIMSKEINVWELELNDYDTLCAYGQLLKEEKEAKRIADNCVVHKEIEIDEKLCFIQTFPCRTEYGVELLEDMFEVKRSEVLQLEWLKRYNRDANPR